jgi:hypothetical protein
MLQTLVTFGAAGHVLLVGALGAALTTPPANPLPSDRARTIAVAARAHDEPQRRRDQGQDDHRGRWVVVEGDRMAQSFKVGEGGSLRISNLAGDVIISGGGGGEIRVEAIKHGKGRGDNDARQQLGNVDVQIQKVGSRVEIETTHQRNSRAWVDYTITVPSGTMVDAKTVSGDIRLTNVQGEVRAESVSGDVVATSLSRVASLKSVSGDIEATSVGSDTELAMSSVSGDVIAKGLKSRSANVVTVSGDVLLKGCACGHASAQAVSGSVEYSGKLEKSGRYEFKTHSGSVTLANAGDGFELEASTFSGNLHNELPLGTRSGESNMDRRRGPGRWIKAVLGNGGAYVEIKTFSGDIRLIKGQ